MRTPVILLAFLFALVCAERLPAPIVEENPTPTPKQSAKPKRKRAVKTKATSEKSRSFAKKQRASPSPEPRATPHRSPFEGVWVGTLNVGMGQDVEFTVTIKGTTVVERSARFGTNTYQGTYDGNALKWRSDKWAQEGERTFTPDNDGKRAVVNCSSGAFFSTAGIFRKVSSVQK